MIKAIKESGKRVTIYYVGISKLTVTYDWLIQYHFHSTVHKARMKALFV